MKKELYKVLPVAIILMLKFFFKKAIVQGFKCESFFVPNFSCNHPLNQIPKLVTLKDGGGVKEK